MSIDQKIVRLFLETSPTNVNEIVVMPAVKLVMKKIVNKLQNKRVHGRVFNGILNGVKVSVIRSLVGSPNAAITIECLKRCNVKQVIRIDFCGGVANDAEPINVGNVLIPKIAYCGDGTSSQYVITYPEIENQLEYLKNPLLKTQELKTGNQNVYISKPNNELMNLLHETGKLMFPKSVKLADFWTTDALFCETDDFINSLKSINVLGIDMESSILFMLGKFFDIKTASILSVSDMPGTKHGLFKTNVIHPEMENGINNAIKILLKALPKLQK